MPELPEVHTTVKGLEKTVIGLKITGIWTDYKSNYKHYINQIKNPSYFSKFKKWVEGQKIVSVERRHKNVLIHLGNGKTVLVHMKMTGHLLYGKYKKKERKSKNIPDRWEKEKWVPNLKESEELRDPFNRHIHLVITLSDGKHLVLSDARKFAKVLALNTDGLEDSKELKDLGPEPLEKSFTYKKFKERILSKPKTPIKTVLMDKSVIAGIGNIYSDEILWSSGVHPESRPEKIPEEKLKDIFKKMKPTLRKGIKFRGDSTSDYRDIKGRRGNFQNKHNVYRRKGEKCPKKDSGVIQRKEVGGRSAHFCPKHQVKY